MKNTRTKALAGLLLTSALLLTGCFQEVPSHDGSSSSTGSGSGSASTSNPTSTPSASAEAKKGPVATPKQTALPEKSEKLSSVEGQKVIAELADAPYGIDKTAMSGFVSQGAASEEDAKNIETFLTKAGYDPAEGATLVLSDFQQLVNNAALYKAHTCDDVKTMVSNTPFNFTADFWKSVGDGFKESAKTKKCLPFLRIADTDGNIDVGDAKAKHNLETLPMMNAGENEVSGFTFQHSFDDRTSIDHLLVSFDHKMLVVTDSGTYRVVTRYRIDAIPSADNKWFIHGIDWFKNPSETKKVG